VTRERPRAGGVRPGSPLRDLPGIGPATARRLAAAGYETVGELLGHLPYRYEDRTTIASVAEVLGAWDADPAPRKVTLQGRLEGVRRLRLGRRGLSLVRGRLRDATGDLPVVWFNRPYLPAQIAEGVDYLLHGEVRATPRSPAGGAGPPELLNPSCEPAERALLAGGVVPVYPAAGELGPAAMRRLLARALAALDPAAVPEPLPDGLRRRHRLPALGEALRALHRPVAGASAAELDRRRSPAHRRLIYGELLEVQLAIARLRAQRESAPKGHRYGLPERLAALAAELLPFLLTADQDRALAEIGADLARPEPMARLLQGEVGSGKTAVAALALAHAAESGLQGALMAPTELLAEQHHRNLRRLLDGRCRVALLAGRGAEGGDPRTAVARGEVDVVVGTHALIQERVGFRRLGLVVVDEQHRFGVLQRRSLEGKGARPDLLVMTATPIPRSLALTQYGELDLSVIAELPPGRRPVATELVAAARRPELYRRLAAALDAGERAYVVFPRIEAGDGAGAPSLEREGEEVRAWLGPERTAALHGGLDPAVREERLAAFAAGRVAALLATTVVEVGLDVPEAAWMVIEGAERYGLAQLHQLRGRVGRGAAPSRCVAVVGVGTAVGRRRLEVFASCSDGFRIAEEDLRLRGFGELLGTRQAGVLGFRVADPVADREWLEVARGDALAVVGRLGEAGWEGLRRRVERRLEVRRRLLGEG